MWYAPGLECFVSSPVAYFPARGANGSAEIGVAEERSDTLPIAGDGLPSTGRFLFIEAPRASNISFDYRLRYGTTLPGAGVNLPVVRESDFARSLRIVGLHAEPTGGVPSRGLSGTDVIAPYRLRMYALDGDGSTRVVVRACFRETYFRLQPPQQERVVELNARDGDDPSYPWYASIDVKSLFALCFSAAVSGGCLPLDFTLEIEAQAPDERIWAFVSRGTELRYPQ